MSKRKIEPGSPASSQQIQVSYQGCAGSYSHLAAKQYFNQSNVVFQSTENLAEVFNRVISNASHYAVIPIESSTNGTIHGVYDRLLGSEGSITILAEISVMESHCLCVPSKTSDLEIENVFCHPHILGINIRQ
jgi:prephenate dehydratase